MICNTNIRIMDKKKVKIREIFLAMSPEMKNEVRKKISERFGISVDSAKVNWIYNSKIPDENVDEVLEIVKAQAKTQSDNLLELIDAI